MSDLIHRAQRALRLAEDASLPEWERLCRGLEAFSGLELTALSADIARQFEADIAPAAHLLASYAPASQEDYARVAAADREQMLQALNRAATQGINAELDRIVAGLDRAVSELPEEAIREAQEHRDLMIPKLIACLKEATAAARQGQSVAGNAHFFAIFLLTEFQAREAFPAILEIFSLPGELPFDLFGDVVTDTFARILALFAGDRPEVLDALIRAREVNEYVRWEASQCYLLLVRDGRLTRGEALERMTQNLRWAIAEEDDEVISGLICEMVTLAPEEALAEIREADHLGVLDESVVSIEDVERSIAEGEEWTRRELQRLPPTGIPDAIEELQGWAAFAEEPAPKPPPPPRSPSLTSLWGLDSTDGPAPIARGAKVGRNEPCPCGSGKKYKKCCGSRA